MDSFQEVFGLDEVHRKCRIFRLIDVAHCRPPFPTRLFFRAASIKRLSASAEKSSLNVMLCQG
jgi:hypothetical protein